MNTSISLLIIGLLFKSICILIWQNYKSVERHTINLFKFEKESQYQPSCASWSKVHIGIAKYLYCGLLTLSPYGQLPRGTDR